MKMYGWLLVVFFLQYFEFCQPQGRHIHVSYYLRGVERKIWLSVLNTVLMAVWERAREREFLFVFVFILEIAAVFNAGPLTWTEASSNCSLLGPNIQTELTTAKISTQGVHVKGWIGAYKGSTAWLNIKGNACISTCLYSFETILVYNKSQKEFRCTYTCLSWLNKRSI